MLDFKKKIINSNKFRNPVLRFLETGSYCSYPKNTTEYYDFWEDERRKCIDGFTAEDGDFITGYHYFYLNYCPIVRMINKEIEAKDGSIIIKKSRERAFPDFYDYDYYYYQAIELAEQKNKHLCVAKSRRKGYSYKGGSMMCRNFFLIPDSKSYVYAANKQYLTDDGILTKAWDYMDFIDENTAWGKKRQVANTSMRRRASFIITDEFGNKREEGYKSEIIGVSLKDNPDVVRGKAARLILFEEAGSFPELVAAWQVARPSVEHDGVAFGLMIMFGTGGDEGAAIAALKGAFYDPNSYNCLGFTNIWDDGLTDRPCGFFIPQHTNLDVCDEYGNRLYMDKDGNTLHDKAQEYILNLRHEELKNATDSRAVDRYVAERCESPMEAFMELSGNIFPKKEMQTHLARIRTNTKLQAHKQVGDLLNTDGHIQWVPKAIGDIREYNTKRKQGTDYSGAVVIWEHPLQDAPFGMYIAGCDPYDHDQSGTNSLGSVFIYKRFQTLEEYHDILVAEYTGRPATAEDFYEQVRKLLIYYNARLMYENMNKGLFSYFVNKHSDYLLADQPDIINDIVAIRRTTTTRKKGCHMTKEIKLWGEGLIKEWLTEEIAPNTPRLTTILSEPLLEELIAYNNKGNFDRVMALMQVMIYREQLYNVQVKNKNDVEKNQLLFDFHIFSDKNNSQDDNYTTIRTGNDVPIFYA